MTPPPSAAGAPAIVSPPVGATLILGAFAFPVTNADAAVIISLAPGAYTAQLGGAAGTSGNALIEIYELQ